MTLPLDGITVVEVSSFVAAPLCGLTLSQLGAEVIRVDPIGGAADFRRWPLAESGTSIYWTGLNKGKRSAAIDLRFANGQQLVQRLIAEGDGIVVTNAAGLAWLSHERLAAMRSDVISVQLLGRGDGSTGVDYTVNAAIGFPYVTGPADYAGPFNHVLPAWDVCCGLYAALAVTAALRRRDQTGDGTHVRLALEDVALATVGNLGLITEPQVNGTQRPRLGNAIFGQYGQDFTSRDGASFMVVLLTGRHFRDLVEVTGTGAAVSAVADALGTDFSSEGDRYQRRAVRVVFDVVRRAFGRRDQRRAVVHHRVVRAVSDVRGGGQPTIGWWPIHCSHGCNSPASESISRPGCRCRSTEATPRARPPRTWGRTRPDCSPNGSD